MDGDRVQDGLERARSADLARLGLRLRHSVENLGQMAVWALVFVERHGKGRLAAVREMIGYSPVSAPSR